MSARLAVARILSAPDEWNRRRLQVLLALAAVVFAAVVGGAIWSVVELLRVGGAGSGRSGAVATAGRPLGPASAPIEAAQPGPLSSADPGSIPVPQPSRLGETQVGSGFQRTSEGALGQLIAIDQRALESGSVVTAQDVISAWAAPGGPTAATWSGVAAVQRLLESAGLPANGSPELTIQLDPAMGRVDHDGARTTACVDFVMSATVTGSQPTRIAVADCQHMLWQSGRWIIAPGEEAPATPSLWPGTQASYDVGYQWLEIQP
jgi:hypothetical protein